MQSHKQGGGFNNSNNKGGKSFEKMQSPPPFLQILVNQFRVHGTSP